MHRGVRASIPHDVHRTEKHLCDTRCHKSRCFVAVENEEENRVARGDADEARDNEFDVQFN